MLEKRVGLPKKEETHYQLVDHLSQLPHRILQQHHLNALSQMILHEIGHKEGFGLRKAIYLIDNPDFNHLIGSAGFCSDECHYHKADLWRNPDSFSTDMKDANFHNDVKKFLRQSLKRQDVNLDDASDVQELGKSMGLEDPQFFSWNMKHDNHGLLVFDSAQEISPFKRRLLVNAAALLSLCGI